MLVLIDCYGCEHIKTMDCHLSCANKDAPIRSRRTNADRIRAMSDEELYTFLNAIVTHQEDVWCLYRNDCGPLLGQGHRTMDCRDCIYEWLKEEVNNERI